MKNQYFLLVLLFFVGLGHADDRWRDIATSVIEDSMCIPALNGEGFLHVDEDVSGLIIQVVGVDGTSIALFDTGTEYEDIAVLGTYAAPSANNVRVSPDALTGGDCTQMMFADAVYSGEDWIQIRVTDGQTTIMDYTRWVYLDLLTTTDLGLFLGPFAITTVTDPTHFILPDGPSNADALNNTWAFIEGGTEQCFRQIIDYAVGPPTVTLRAACPFTVTATTDTIEIRASASGDALAVVDSVVNSNASAITAVPTAEENTDEWETQSQADPTGFHVNHMETNSTAQTAGDIPALITTAQADLNIITDADGVILGAAGVNLIWDEVIETAGVTYTARCILAISQSQSAGTFSQVGNVRTYKDPSGASDRVVGTISGTTRSGMTVTCP